MNDPRQIAEGIVGQVDWQNEVSGFCRCPGESLHTNPNGKKDCRVNVDGTPTVFCFHSSCIEAVSEANRRLRRELGAWSWEIALPGGRVLRNGDVLQKDGTVKRREVLAGDDRWQMANGRGQPEKVILETVRVMAERFRPELFERFHWSIEEIMNDSPMKVCERDAEDQFRTWLKLWPAHCHVWVGDVFTSGKPEHWYQIGPVMGNYTCGSSFKPGSFSRCNENLNGQRFLVVESDTLGRDEVGAVFTYLHRRLRYKLHCIIDTAGKSLHAWFDAPRNKIFENRLKVGLTALGCDPKVFSYSQPVRVPGAWREGRLQRIVWLRE